MTTTSPITNPRPNTGARFRRTVIAAMAVLALTSLVVAGSAGAASAHDGHDTPTSTTTRTTPISTPAPTPTSTSTLSRTSTDSGAIGQTRTELAAREVIERFHLAAINGLTIDDGSDQPEIGVRGRTAGDLIQAPGGGQA